MFSSRVKPPDRRLPGLGHGLTALLIGCLIVLAACAPAPIFERALPAVDVLDPDGGLLDDPATLRFAVIGDFGTPGRATLEVADLVQGWDPALVLTTGDNNYPQGGADTIDDNVGRGYQSFIAPYHGRYGRGGAVNRFFPSLGNHDWDTEAGGPYLRYFTLPGNERYYTFATGDVRFFALSSDPREPDGITVDSAQAAWLREELAASTACWNVVYFHHPPYSSSRHGSSRWMRWPFREWGADAVIAGHDHVYERIERDGLTYFINGLGGASTYGFGQATEGSRVRFNAAHGAMLGEAARGRLTFRFLTTGGAEIDRHRLTKECQ